MEHNENSIILFYLNLNLVAGEAESFEGQLLGDQNSAIYWLPITTKDQ